MRIVARTLVGQTQAFDIEGGRIAAIHPAPMEDGRRLAIPGLVNAHDHARPLSPTSFGGAGKPLESWLLRLPAMPPVDPYLAGLAAFGRAARAGCVSIMAHYTRWQGPMPQVEEAALLARAARDIGVRIAFAPALRDRNPLVYGDAAPVLDTLPGDARLAVEQLFSAPAIAPRERVAQVEAIAAAIGGPLVDVQFGPAGMQWCSDALLEEIAQASALSGRRVHMHLLETRYQRDFADRHYPQGIVRRLKEIGLLSPRLALAHCVYARPDELEMIAQSGAVIVTNPSSNLHLRSGVAPIGAALRAAAAVALGVDASALDEDDDVLREMRLAHFLHQGWGFDENISRAAFIGAIVADGRRANGHPGAGRLEPGAEADLVVLDLEALDRDRIMPVDPLDLLFSRAHQGHVREVIVAGEAIVRDGRILRADLDAVHQELRDQYRKGLPSRRDYLAAWPYLEPAVRRHFTGQLGCC